MILLFNQLLCILLNHSAWNHYHMGASTASQPEISTDSKNLPFITSAWMTFF